jgi:hypothetical protein
MNLSAEMKRPFAIASHQISDFSEKPEMQLQ